jgi:hypothetical protein
MCWDLAYNGSSVYSLPIACWCWASIAWLDFLPLPFLLSFLFLILLLLPYDCLYAFIHWCVFVGIDDSYHTLPIAKLAYVCTLLLVLPLSLCMILLSWLYLTILIAGG